MAFALPQTADQQTLSGKFFDALINGTIKATVTNFDAQMQDRGDWVQCIGEQDARNNPDTRWGSGTMDNLEVVLNDVTDILVASGDAAAGDAATGEIDFRFPELTIAVMYNDGRKKYTRTFAGTLIRQRGFTVQGNRLATGRLTFEFKRETLSYN